MATVEPQPRLARPGIDMSETRAARAEVERLYSEHGERVQAICASILRDRHEAEDASQQVFVSALRALRRGAVPRDAAAWLAAIARHESWARQGHQPTTPLHEGLEDRAQEDPAATVVRRAELAEAWHGIAALPASQREALLLREVRGLAYDELADDLRLSHASVRSLLSRARRTLRMQLEKGAAALTGAQWLNALSRLVADTSSPTLSSATRTGAVGLGALAIAGGAVIGPNLTHQPRTVAHHLSATSRAQRVAADSGLVAATVSSPAPTRAAQARLGQLGSGRGVDRGEDRRRDGKRRGAGGDRRGGSGSQTSGRDSSGSDGSSGGGPGPTASVVRSDGARGRSDGGGTGGSSPASSGSSGSDGSADAFSAVDTSGTSGKGSSGGASGSSGSSASGGSSGGPGTTVTSPTLGSSSGDGSGGSSGSDGSGS